MATPLELQMMLDRADVRATERKRRLFAVACCRRISHLMTESRCQQMLEMADNLGLLSFIENKDIISPAFLMQTVEDIESLAEGEKSAQELEQASDAADTLHQVIDNYYACYSESWGPIDQDLLATSEAAGVLYEAISYSAFESAKAAARAVYRSTGDTEEDIVEHPAEIAAQCELVRDIFGCPTQLVADPGWQTSTIQGLAREIYEDRSFELLPILGDALEDVGADAAILDHLRSPGPHVRGCWALDLVLGKS